MFSYIVVDLFFRLCFIFGSAELETKELKLGVILPYKGKQPWALPKTLPAIEVAVETIHKRSLLPGYRVIIHHNDSKCSDLYGPLAAMRMQQTGSAHVFVGPACDYAVAPIGRFSKVWGIPVLSAGGLVHAFQNKAEYPLLTRVMGSYAEVGKAFLHLCQRFQWKTVGLIYSDLQKDSGGKSRGFFTMEPIYLSVSRVLGYTPWHRNFPEDVSKDQVVTHLRDILTEAKTQARVLVVATKPRLLPVMMSVADQLGMTSGDFVFIVIDLFLRNVDISQPWAVAEDNSNKKRSHHHRYRRVHVGKQRNVKGPENINQSINSHQATKHMFDCVLLMTMHKPDTESFFRFSRDVRERAAAANLPGGYEKDEEVSNFVVAFHDAVLLFAHALNETLELGGSVEDGREITRRMWNRTITGISGNVSIDSNGDRQADYSLYDLDPAEDRFELVSIFNGLEGEFKKVIGREIHWAGSRKAPPPDVPVCGMKGQLCPPDEPFPVYGVITIILAALLVIVLIATFVGVRHVKSEAELSDMSWRIRHEEILMTSAEKHNGAEPRELRKLSIPSTMSFDSVGVYNSKSPGQLFTTTGYVKGYIAALKPINRNAITITKSVLLDIKKIKSLQNEHVVRFLGVCIDTPNACIVTEYCPKGSLQDILENEEIHLDWMFRYSIMQDIVRGMSYLHCSEIRYHGNLKSSNCVVDSRFVVKLTDFGLPYFRYTVNLGLTPEKCYAHYRNHLWTAPELLRIETSTPNNPAASQKGDVYSFAVICQEIVYRHGVFHIEGSQLTPREIIANVKTVPSDNKVTFRPTLVTSDLPCEELGDVIRKCWAEEPNERPPFVALKSIIRKLNKEGDKGNILDNLLTRMEQYASNLETLVAERTADYMEEKKKAENLLYSMLPRTVAEQLIRGESVKAVSFESVTIYFSDIVGFTTMSALCSPIEVVTLLNDLYTTFDSILGHFDVYKVETIGDAYMVASGLPVPNGKAHAKEIARMSLELLKAVHSFVIRHNPDERLKLRIGIHSGSVCAGVVGLKMPRYCLFGDTVNTASRMESTGLPLKIHVSATTKEYLDSFEMFHIELRGEIEMKGKGKVTTYWLIGEKEMDTVFSTVL